MIIKDQSFIDFSGGIVRNQSSYVTKKNQLLSAYNVEIDELGRVIRRRGYQHHGAEIAYGITGGGDTLDGCENSFMYLLSNVSSALVRRHFVNDEISTGIVAEVMGDRLTTAITASSTSIVLNSATNFPNSAATIEIEGDIINYGSVTGSTLNTVSNVTSSHAVGAPVHILREITQPSTAFDFTQGGYYALASDGTTPNSCFVSSRNVLSSVTSGAFSAPITFSDDTDNVQVLFIKNYRDRLYGCGSGAATLANSGMNRVFYSALGNASDNNWTKANNFDLPGDGDISSAEMVYNDVLYIFKINHLYSYNQITLKRRSAVMGAYNNKVPQEINGLIYTFCPSGVWVSNGLSHRKISQAVEPILRRFKPAFDSNNRVVINTFAFKWKDTYNIFLSDMTFPETQDNVILTYDTIKKSWSMSFWANNFLHINSFARFLFGGRVQEFEGLFAGADVSNTYRYFRLFSNEHINGADNSFGGDLLLETFFNTGLDVAAHFETPLYDLNYPQYIKKFKYIRGLSEVVGWQVSYRIENDKGITPYRTIGQFQKPNERLLIPQVPAASGYRIGFRFSNNDRNSTGIFNGFIIEDTEILGAKQ